MNTKINRNEHQCELGQAEVTVYQCDISITNRGEYDIP
jgi:hypothetical protein